MLNMGVRDDNDHWGIEANTISRMTSQICVIALKHMCFAADSHASSRGILNIISRPAHAEVSCIEEAVNKLCTSPGRQQ